MFHLTVQRVMNVQAGAPPTSQAAMPLMLFKSVGSSNALTCFFNISGAIDFSNACAADMHIVQRLTGPVARPYGSPFKRRILVFHAKPARLLTRHEHAHALPRAGHSSLGRPDRGHRETEGVGRIRRIFALVLAALPALVALALRLSMCPT